MTTSTSVPGVPIHHQIWLQSRGQRRDQDYRWRSPYTADLPPNEHLSFAEGLAASGQVTIVVWWQNDQPDSSLLVYLGGIRAASWPTDPNGRPIRLSVFGVLQTPREIIGLTQALRNFTKTDNGQDALEACIRFDADLVDGFEVRAKALTYCQVGSAVAPSGLSMNQMTWLPLDEVDIAIKDVCGVLANLTQPDGRTGGYSPNLLLVVSSVIDEQWCRDHQPFRAAGPHIARCVQDEYNRQVLADQAATVGDDRSRGLGRYLDLRVAVRHPSEAVRDLTGAVKSILPTTIWLIGLVVAGVVTVLAVRR